jgi:LCP family protein required for cell wall assembly
MTPRQRIIWGAWLVVFLVLGFLGWRFHRFWTQPLTSGGADTSPSAASELNQNRFTLLILGADDRPDRAGRADSIFLSFVDLEKGDVKLLSIPRDSYVEIPGHGWDKINHSYAFGHVPLVKKTVENLTGIPIDYWVKVDMNGFQAIVDAVGGVDVVIDHDLDYEDPTDTPPLIIHLKKGAQRLNGEDALRLGAYGTAAAVPAGARKGSEAAV